MNERRSRALVLAAALLFSACAKPAGPGSQQALLDALGTQLRFQYHNCVPLGWQPVTVAGTYYPGYIASLQSYEEFLDAIWRGRIEIKDAGKSDVSGVFESLNHLANRGMLIRKQTAGAYDYFLTPAALPYYYGSSLYGNNKAHLQYLCYTVIVPDRIVWIQRINRLGISRSHAQWYDVAFTWRTSPPESWANDPYLLSHSVVLAPLKSPTLAKMIYSRNEWYVLRIYDGTWGLPLAPGRVLGRSD
jgi:hypothetical protein